MIVNQLDELIKLVSEFKKDNFKIGTMNGTFDLLHEGHISALNFALKSCDKLFVLINSDKSVRMYKGNGRPIKNQKIRAQEIQNNFPNSYIFVFNELHPINFLKLIKPQIHFLGPDWQNNTLEEDFINSIDGEILHIEKKLDISTTQILEIKGYKEESKKAIFFDRDGTLIVDKNYLSNKNDIEFFPHTFETIEYLIDLGYLIFIVSNQSMVGRKMLSKKKVIEINNEILKRFKKANILITKCYLDFSHPNKNSQTRKPNTKFLQQASKEYNIALKNSWVIGDKDSDIVFGKLANAKTIQIKGSYQISKYSDYVINNIEEIKEII